MGIKSFYGSLALNNIRKNIKGFAPYILTCICSIMIFYIMTAIAYNPDITKMTGGETLKTMLGLGSGVIGFFSAIFLFYTNSFLIKQRKKELAIYNILGMAKVHVGKLFFVESLYTSLISLILGILSGVILGKLVFLALLKITRVSMPIDYTFSLKGALISVLVFGLIFFIVLICNLGRIRLTNPIQLMMGTRQGEKEPRANWFLAIIGLVLTGIGYVMALSVESPLQALLYFFYAVILVIVGTYLLFISGSIALLKLLKRKKSFYYKANHFTAISGMLYRMKRNAAGLASICILSTMVLVTVSTTVSLQIGTVDVVKRNFPHDIQVECYGQLKKNEQETITKHVEETLKDYHVSINKVTKYKKFSFSAFFEDGSMTPTQQFPLDKNVVEVQVIPVKGSTLEREYGNIEKGEIIIGGDNAIYRKKMKIGSQTFVVKNGESSFKAVPLLGSMVQSYYILVADEEVQNQIMKDAGLPRTSDYFIGIDMNGDDWQQAASAVEKLEADFPSNIDVGEREGTMMELRFLYGGLLFVGIFLGILFLMIMVLMIYYKQITEGYEDAESYAIMKKVGMSLEEIRSSIRSQILIVFFLPLLGAVLHTVVAFNMMSKLLIALQISNVMLFVIATIVTIFIFTIIYVGVYGMTAREYYKLVR